VVLATTWLESNGPHGNVGAIAYGDLAAKLATDQQLLPTGKMQAARTAQLRTCVEQLRQRGRAGEDIVLAGDLNWGWDDTLGVRGPKRVEAMELDGLDLVDMWPSLYEAAGFTWDGKANASISGTARVRRLTSVASSRLLDCVC
jgi:hypothetical protein